MFLFKAEVKTGKGFSLIELMVVMAIISVLMGLTGALLTKSVSQHQKQIEVERVHQLFKQLSYKAFYGGASIKVKLSEHSIEVSSLDKSSILDFKQITFVASSHVISTSAVISPLNFSIINGKGFSTFTLGSIYKNHDNN